jgi:hypothetical protein
MKSEATTCRSRDILSNLLLAGALWWLPIIAMVATAYLKVGSSWRTVVWMVALAVMGGACVANAILCGRVHCYATGPFFLAMALVTLFYGLGVLPLGRNGWNFIGLATLVGGVVLCCLPEAFLGRYRQH